MLKKILTKKIVKKAVKDSNKTQEEVCKRADRISVFVRDICSNEYMAKSEVKKMLDKILKAERKEERNEVLDAVEKDMWSWKHKTWRRLLLLKIGKLKKKI